MSAPSRVTAASPAAAPAARRARTVRAATLLAAVLVDVGIWVGVAAIGGVPLAYSTGGQTATVGIVSVIAAAAVTGLLGWALSALLSKITRHATAIWTATAVVFVIVSLASPILLAQGRAAMTALVCMHVSTAVIVIAGFRLSSSAPEGRVAARPAAGPQTREPTP